MMREKAAEISACEAITVAAVANAMSGQKTFGSVAGSIADLVIFMGLFAFSDLNEVRFLLAQLLCQQMRTELRC